MGHKRERGGKEVDTVFIIISCRIAEELGGKVVGCMLDFLKTKQTHPHIHKKKLEKEDVLLLATAAVV